MTSLRPTGPPPNHPIIDKCLSPNKTVIQGNLPLQLRQRPTAVSAACTTGTRSGFDPGQGGGSRGGRGTGGRGGGAQGRGRSTQGPTGAAGGTNAQHHPNWRAFWSTIPPTPPPRSALWLQTAGSSTTQALATLGLTPADCFQFHVRGVCNRPNCPNNHTPKALDPRNIDRVVALLTDGRRQAT